MQAVLFCWDAVVETKKVLEAVEYIMFFLLVTSQHELQRRHKYFIF